SLRLVDWADEEGRFGVSVFGSSAVAGTLAVDKLKDLADKDGVKLVDALRENGVSLERIGEAQQAFKQIDARAYLEIHIEQGPVLEMQERSTGVVLGTFGLERHRIRFGGQAAHAGATPIAMRRDAFLAAAELALESRAIALSHVDAEAAP